MADRPSAAATLSVIIVDDEQLARDELAFLLKSFPQVHVAAAADNGLDAVELIKSIRPTWSSSMSRCPGWTAWASSAR